MKNSSEVVRIVVFLGEREEKEESAISFPPLRTRSFISQSPRTEPLYEAAAGVSNRKQVRERPDMMSTSEGRHGKADEIRGVA